MTSVATPSSATASGRCEPIARRSSRKAAASPPTNSGYPGFIVPAHGPGAASLRQTRDGCAIRLGSRQRGSVSASTRGPSSRKRVGSKARAVCIATAAATSPP
jgi:hypothetical protein